MCVFCVCVCVCVCAWSHGFTFIPDLSIECEWVSLSIISTTLELLRSEMASMTRFHRALILINQLHFDKETSKGNILIRFCRSKEKSRQTTIYGERQSLGESISDLIFLLICWQKFYQGVSSRNVNLTIDKEKSSRNVWTCSRSVLIPIYY